LRAGASSWVSGYRGIVETKGTLTPGNLSDILYDSDMPSQCRINARLDKTLARKVGLVQKRTRRSLSQVVQESLARYCDEELSDGGEPLSILKAAGFVGCADGPADLSSAYKKDLTRSLGRKA
jgi:hypothetical protein